MKCPHCLAVCMASDPVCYSCRSPLAARAVALPGAETGKPSYARRWSLFGVCLGWAGGQVAGGLLMAGVGAVVGGTVGLALGTAIHGTGKQPA